MTTTIDEKLTTAQAARAIGVSEQTIRIWTRSKRLRGEPTPLGHLYDAREIGRVIAQREALARERRGGSGGKGRAEA